MLQDRPGKDEVRTALEKVTASEYFASSGQLAGLLRNLTDAALSPEADASSEAGAANASAGRDVTLDPRRFPAAAEEIELLRNRLEQYYQGLGRWDPVRISLPQGGTLPRFEYAQRSAAPQTEAGAEELTPMPRGWKLAGTLALLAVAGILLGWWQAASMRRLREAPIATIAVLPFQTDGADPGDEALSDQLTEGIAGRLTQTPGVRVVDRNLIAQYRNRPLPPEEAATRLNASMLLEGSLRRRGDRLRIAARLTALRNGATVWVGSYECGGAGVTAAQDVIAHSIAAALHIQPRGASQTSPAKQGP